MSSIKTLHFLGYASGVAAPTHGSADAATTLQQSPHMSILKNYGISTSWDKVLAVRSKKASPLIQVADLSSQLAEEVNRLVTEKKFFVVIGGDHSCAIGTWSGASHAVKEKGPLGLLWIDAHMDSHTPETTETGNIHGMPVAALLGYGDPSLTNIMNDQPKINPQHLCLIGVRSFESKEAELLNRLNVKIYYMEEVKKRGLKPIMKEAIQFLSKNSTSLGVTIDIDSMDPQDAPATGVTESDGIRAKELCQALTLLANHPKLIGVEIAEFDPHLDVYQKTEKIIPKIILSIMHGKSL